MTPRRVDIRDRRPSVTYARVSSQEQAKEGFSIPAQDKLLSNYAREKDLDVTAAFTDVETAKKAGRTGPASRMDPAPSTRLNSRTRMSSRNGKAASQARESKPERKRLGKTLAH